MSTKDGRLWYALRGLPGKPQVATVVLMIALIALAVRRYIARPLAEPSRRVISFSTDESAARTPVRDEVELLIGEFRELGEELAKARADLLEKHRSEIELERPRLHSDRLATIGSLAAGLAHEIGTPMGVIRGRAEYLLHSRMDSQKTGEGLEIIITQIDRITSIVRMLLDYSRYRESRKMTADLRPIVQPSIHFESAGPVLRPPHGSGGFGLMRFPSFRAAHSEPFVFSERSQFDNSIRLRHSRHHDGVAVTLSKWLAEQ